jgi:hypothetical protein
MNKQRLKMNTSHMPIIIFYCALPLFHYGGSIILNALIGASKGDSAASVYSPTKSAIRSFART